MEAPRSKDWSIVGKETGKERKMMTEERDMEANAEAEAEGRHYGCETT